MHGSLRNIFFLNYFVVQFRPTKLQSALQFSRYQGPYPPSQLSFMPTVCSWRVVQTWIQRYPKSCGNLSAKSQDTFCLVGDSLSAPCNFFYIFLGNVNLPTAYLCFFCLSPQRQYLPQKRNSKKKAASAVSCLVWFGGFFSSKFL